MGRSLPAATAASSSFEKLKVFFCSFDFFSALFFPRCCFLREQQRGERKREREGKRERERERVKERDD